MRTLSISRSILWLGLFLLAYSPAAQGCDICGCGVGNYYFGLMPQFHRNFVGLRWRHTRYDSHLNISRTGRNNLFASTETFHTLEMWARWYPTARWQILTFLPYHYNQQSSPNTDTKYLQGMGDIVLMSNYRLWHSEAEKSAWRHSLFVGLGIKIPTGSSKFSADDMSQVANPNFQLGTGSIDALMGMQYNFRRGQWGLNADANYKINTANSEGYRFGNRLSGNISAFFVQKVGKIGLMPNIGLYIEHSDKNTTRGQIIAETGGALTASAFGLEVYYGWLNIGTNIQLPLAQRLAEGNIKAHSRALLHLTVVF